MPVSYILTGRKHRVVAWVVLGLLIMDCLSIARAEPYIGTERLASAVPSALPAPTKKTIGRAGGSIELNKYAKISFAADTFTATTSVKLDAVQLPWTVDRFAIATSTYNTGERSSYEIRLNTGRALPKKNITAVINVPAPIISKLKSGFSIDIFGALESYSELGMSYDFHWMPTIFDTSKKTATVTVPQAFFADRGQSGTWEAIFILSSSPKFATASTSSLNKLAEQMSSVGTSGLSAQVEAPKCLALGFPCPLANGCTIASNFGMRLHPIKNKLILHEGVDYRAPLGTIIRSPVEGVVRRVVKSNEGYGYQIIIEHLDGSRMRYAHLKATSLVLKVGALVDEGTKIGEVGQTGLATGPHLHLEYYPNVKLYDLSKLAQKVIDPAPCSGLTAGSITVSDNGSAKDDAFDIILDSKIIGSTSIGGSGVVPINNILPGSHLLSIFGNVVPDNRGTYKVDLFNGLVFRDGGTSTSGIVTEGGVADLAIIAPPKP